MKLEKKCILFLMILSILFMVSCENSEKGKTEKNTDVKISKDAVDISIVRESAQSDYDNAKSKYTNLDFSDITPYCTPYDKVYDIERHQLGNYKGITDEKEMYEEQMKLINKYIGTDLEDEYFSCGYYDLDTNEYSSFAEFREDLLSGKKMDATWLAYNEEELLPYKFRHAEIQLTLPNVFFSKGKTRDSIPLEVREREMIYNVMEGSEFIKSYYVYGNEDSLDDVYTLKNGDMSIRDAVDFVNYYLNNELGIEGNENVSLQVVKVEVYAPNDTHYFYRFVVTRNIYGLLQQTKNAGYATSYIDKDNDMSEAIMVYTDELDLYCGRTTRLNCETFNETDKIISLDKALYNISESIGENSKYKIMSVEMGYLDKITDLITTNEGIMTASWIINCESELDNSTTEFYVNVRTGDIEVYQYY